MNIIGTFTSFHDSCVRPSDPVPCGEKTAAAFTRGSGERTGALPVKLVMPLTIIAVNAPYEWPLTPIFDVSKRPSSSGYFFSIVVRLSRIREMSFARFTHSAVDCVDQIASASGSGAGDF